MTREELAANCPFSACDGDDRMEPLEIIYEDGEFWQTLDFYDTTLRKKLTYEQALANWNGEWVAR